MEIKETKPDVKPEVKSEAKPKPEFTSVKDAKPKIKVTGKLSRESGMLHLKDSHGKIVAGYYMEYLTDINSPALTVKKGDHVFHTADNVTLKNIQGWKEI